MKKIYRKTSLLLICSLLFGMFACVTHAAGFRDVKQKDYFYDAVNWAVEKGVTLGTAPTSFSPNEQCTRAQVVTFLWRAAGQPTARGANPFSDVKKGAYYYKAVLWAVSKGVTTGTSKTRFSPDAVCTRGQVVAFLWRSVGKPEIVRQNPFTDVRKGQYYYKAVLWAVGEGITNGTAPKHFSPDETCSRGQIVTFLHRCYVPISAKAVVMAASNKGLLRTFSATGDLAKLGKGEYLTFALILKNNTSIKRALENMSVETPKETLVWNDFALSAGQQMTLYIGESEMKPYQKMGNYAFRYYVDGTHLLTQSFVIMDSSYADQSTYWSSVINLPTVSQIKGYQVKDRVQSQYLSGWWDITDDTRFSEYSIDFKSDHIPVGTYCCLGNWQIDLSPLTQKYKEVRLDTGSIHGYGGLQNTTEGTKAIMSIWQIYVKDSKGKQSIIRPKLIYPTGATAGSFDNEGSGANFIQKFSWEKSHWYRMRFAFTTDSKTGHSILTQYLCDLETGVWTKLCAYDTNISGTCFKGSMAVFLEDYMHSMAASVRSMEVRNMRIRTTDGVWRSIDKIYLSASESRPEYGISYTGRYAFGAKTDRFYMITTGVGGDTYGNGTGQKAAHFTANHTETGKPY